MRSRKRRRKMIRQWRHAGGLGFADAANEAKRRNPVSNPPKLNLPELFDALYRLRRERLERDAA